MIYPESPLPVRIKIILSFLIAIFKISASPVYTSVSEDYKHQNTNCSLATRGALQVILRLSDRNPHAFEK